ncbi:MAG TPA: DNA replication/repair protein RecF [Rhodospirillales bacterium]|nr:DNA replication/repair protein RecF [Rhodospirillales bacterium]
MESKDADASSVSGLAVAQGPASLQRLTLTDFRCYAALRLDVDARPVILTGANGAGKTNILEAVSFLVPGRGLRGARLAEIARSDPGSTAESPRQWAVSAIIETPVGPVNLGTGRDQPGHGGREKRLVHIDGERVSSQSRLADYLSIQWLTPQMDRLFVEGPSARRRFLDRLVFGFDPAHAGRVSAYEHALRERSRLLRHGQPGTGRPADPEWLSVLEDSMATRGVAVAAARLQLAQRLGQIAARKGAFPGATIAVSGDVEQWLGEGPALQAEDRFRAALANCRSRDSENGSTGLGPHRSDLIVHHTRTGQVAALCSTGEQKALLIALILANARLQAAERGSLPLLLLDEVAAHLDQTRRQALFDEILALGIQAWMTGTDMSLFDAMARTAQFFSVDNATLAAQSPQ